MTAIVDYNTGNLCSVRNALHRLNAEFIVTDDAQRLRQADHVILPGVGAAGKAMEELKSRRLDTLITSLTQPVLGICIGIQLLCRSSEEDNTSCLGIFDTSVTRLVAPKVPQIGWNTIEHPTGELMTSVNDNAYVYYVHSFAPLLPAQDATTVTLAQTTYGSTTFAAALRNRNFYGTQFHPEKSGSVGEQLLRNFLSLC